MVRAPYFDKNGIKKGAWSKEEDEKLKAYIQQYGHWNWRQLPKYAGLQRCGKSCRIRWLNYLRPDVKRGGYSKAEEDLIIELHKKLGSKWSKIAEQLPGRTDNEIKNHWHTRLKKREGQNQGTPNQELDDQTIESSKIGVIILDIMEREAENTPIIINPSHPVILESSPFSPAASSAESSSNSALSNVLSDGDELHKKRLWSEEEDDKLRDCIQRHGLSSGWSEVPKLAGLLRSGRSCRLRWMNHLRPEVKHGHYTRDEEDLIIKLHEQLGNKWSIIATQLPGRTDNEIKNHWNAHLRRQADRLNEQPSAISQSLAEASENKEQFIESGDLLKSSRNPSDPMLGSFQLAPESSSSEFSVFCSELNMVDAVTPVEWFMEESFNPLETFESDFWTEPFVLDTACRYQM